MTERRQIRYAWMVAIAVLMKSDLALAFCPMCKTVIEGATGAQEMGSGLNLASLVLMAPPVILFAALFGLFYRLRHASAPPIAATDEQKAPCAPRALTD